ncbi:N-acetyltransferase domain-containing protein [Trichoderma simmonsii]|uniref:N-acetyltransferase domain-containing protein n=1 Tax=Trichoderma simmonsii TaxID=1491479 RepID=A0A8G0PB22_9HYPO|nr:N-acetyltransferase domain-containing protein [Trichoderma simmonsii]
MSQEPLHLAPILFTRRLTLTLIDFDKKDDEEAFIELLGTMVGEYLKISAQEARKNAVESIEFYRSYGRIQPKLLGGQRIDKSAIWLIRLGANSPHGQCIGTTYVVQRSLMPDQNWILLPDYRGMGYATEASNAVLRYFCDGLGLRDMMAVIAPGNLKSPAVAKRLGYVPVEGGMQYEGGVTLPVFALPTAMSFPKGLVFRRFDRLE